MTKVKNAKPIADIPWETFVYYDETSPTCLRHLTNKFTGTYNVRKVGDVAGSVTSGGYCRYNSVDYGDYPVHRIVWYLHHRTDVPDNMLLDHVDGNRTNNKISNLKLISEADNTRNTKMYSNNTTGKTGVYFDAKADRKGVLRYYWKASWMELDGSQKTKAFSVSKFGLLEAQHLASKHRDEQIQRLCHEGAVYTARHGT